MNFFVDFANVLSLLASIFFMMGYGQYYLDIKKLKISPNKWSWIIWSFTTLLESLTFYGVSDDILKSFSFFVSAFSCITVTAKIWITLRWEQPDWTEIFSLSFCLISLSIWFLFKSAWFAHIVLLISLPISFFPTYHSVLLDYKNEYSFSWLYWIIGDILVIGQILMHWKSYQELPYALLEFLCQLTVLSIIGYGIMANKIKNEDPL